MPPLLRIQNTRNSIRYENNQKSVKGKRIDTLNTVNENNKSVGIYCIILYDTYNICKVGLPTQDHRLRCLFVVHFDLSRYFPINLGTGGGDGGWFGGCRRAIRLKLDFRKLTVEKLLTRTNVQTLGGRRANFNFKQKCAKSRSVGRRVIFQRGGSTYHHSSTLVL